jgi:hypothetical protein
MWNNQSGAQRQTQTERVDVNTNLQTFFTDEMMFNFAMWNDKLSVSWTPSDGKDANGYTHYDRTHRVTTAMRYEKVMALVAQYDKKLKKYVEGDETLPGPKSIGIRIGGNMATNTLPGRLILMVSPHDTTRIKTSIILIKTFTPDGKPDPNSIISYDFKTTPVCLDFNPTNLEVEVEEYTQGEFLFFMSVLRYIVLSTPITTHGKRYNGGLRRSLENQAAASSANNTYNGSSSFVSVPEAGTEFPFV